MAKLDLKDAYFCVPLHKQSQKFVRFQWDGKLYGFLCLYFGLGPAARIFTKLLKVPLAVLRRLNMLIIIYIDDMLIIGRTRKEVESTRDTLIYLLQHLGFLLILKKSVLQPCQEIKFLGLIVNSVNLTLSLPLQKVQKVQEECTKMYNKNWTSILELTKLLGLLSSTIQEVVPTRLQRSWWLVVQGRTTASYQCPGTSSNKTSFVGIHQVRINQINSLPNRQQNSNFLSIENGGYTKPNNDNFIKRDLGYFVEKEHNYFSRIPSQCSKQGGRLGVTKQQGLLGLETVSSNL